MFGPDGELILKHRKVSSPQLQRHTTLKELVFKMEECPLSCFQVHLFDIDVPGKIRFQESETLSAGNNLSVFQTRKRRLFRLVADAPTLDDVIVTPPFVPQRSVKWVWEFATTSDLQNWHSCTAGKVSSLWWRLTLTLTLTLSLTLPLAPTGC